MRADVEARAVNLGYSQETATAFADLISRWPQAKLEEGQRVASLERSLGKKIAVMIQDRIAPDQTSSDLADVVKYDRANCLGYAQLFCILGGSAGLSVTPAGVREFQKAGPPPNGLRHICCLVTLDDATTVMVNPAPPIFVSRPFMLEEVYARSGNYLELKSEDNPLGLYRRIQILDDRGLAAHVRNSRGAALVAQNRLQEALEQYERAIALNPLFAEAWNNQAIALRRSGDLNGALSSYRHAIEVDDDYAEAYYNRALCYASLGERDAAKQDLQAATRLNPGLVTVELVARIGLKPHVDQTTARK